MSVYINTNGQQSGPFDEEAVIAQLKNGQLSPDNLAIRQGETEWQKLGAMFPGAAAPANAPSTFRKVDSGCRKIFGYFTILFGGLFLVGAIALLIFFSGMGNGAAECAEAAADAKVAEQAKKDSESAKGTSSEVAAREKARETDLKAFSSNSVCEMISGRWLRQRLIVIVSVVLGLIFAAAGIYIVRMKAAPTA